MITATSKAEAKTAVERLREAVELPEDVWKDARRLARQLENRPVLPLVGAGASVDCGMEPGKPVAEQMYDRYVEENGIGRSPSDLDACKDDLGVVADAIYAAADQSAVIEALGLGSVTEWPESDRLPAHFCSYRILARLVREGLISEAISLNYDCGFERGLEDEGFRFAPWGLHGKMWFDHATVVADGADHARLDPRGEMILTKAHGCAAGFRRVNEELGESILGDESRERLLEKAREAIIVRRGQLLDWRTDLWARDMFADRARRHVILLVGISAQDPVIQIALTRVLEEVYGHLEGDDSELCMEPRVIAIDRCPDTVALTGLVHQGCDRKPPAEDVITSVKVPANRSMTAVLTAIAVEMLALRLSREEGVPLPSDSQAGVTGLIGVAPASLRWTYILERRRNGAELVQRANLEYAGDRGYVPLAADSGRVAESLRVRVWLRRQLGMVANETVDEALSGHGFVVSPGRGCAFMPLGIGVDELRAVPDWELTAAARTLRVPVELESILVAGMGANAVGRVIRTGREVPIP